MAVIWFRDGRPVTDPWSLRCLIVGLCAELEAARRERESAHESGQLGLLRPVGERPGD